MPLYDLVCKNGHEQIDVLLKIGERPHCPVCQEVTETLWRTSSNVVGDDIPGGYEIRHGLCDPDTGEPRKYYSKSEIAREAKRRNLTNWVEHTPPPGTDKSKYTVRWI